MMPNQKHELTAAGAALAAALEAENRLLAELDLAGAAALLGVKQSAANAFLHAQEQAAVTGGIPPHAREALAALAARLRVLAAENRRLLQRGLAAQGRVISVIGRAAREQAARASRYGASGTHATPRSPAALAIYARA